MGLFAVLIGAITRSRPQALVTAACYGFSLALSFMVAGYDGPEPVARHLAGFTVLGLIGCACAMLLAVAGLFLGRARTRAG